MLSVRSALFNLLSKHLQKLSVLADQTIVSGSVFVLGILLARWMGLESFGVYAALTMMILLVNNLNQSFVTTPFLTLRTKIRGGKSYENGVLGMQFLLLAPFGFVFFGIGIFLEALLGISLSQSEFVAFIASGCLYILYEFIRKLFFSRRQPVHTLFFDLSVIGLQFLMVLILQYHSLLSVSNVLFTMALSWFIAIPFIFLNISRLKLKLIRIVFFRHIQFASWLVATSVVQWMSGNLVFLIAGNIFGVATVGILKIGQSMIGSITALYQMVENYIPPRAAGLMIQKGRRVMWSYLMEITAKGGGVILLLAGIIAIVPEELVTFLYGRSYENCSGIIRLFALLSVVNYPGFLFRIGKRTEERTFHIFIAYTLNILASVCLSYPLMYITHIYGAVWALISGQLVMILWYIVSIYGSREEGFVMIIPKSRLFYTGFRNKNPYNQ